MTLARAATVDALRQHLARVAPAHVQVARLASGVPALDVRTGGWPCPGVAAVCGAAGTGRLALVLPALRDATARDRTVALVDAEGWLHPPGLPGVALHRVLLVRPGPERAGWAAEQLARCGALEIVLLLDPPPLGRAGRRLLRAAEDGRTALVVLSERPDPDLPATLRIEMTGRLRARIARGGARSSGDDLVLVPGSEQAGDTLPECAPA